MINLAAQSKADDAKALTDELALDMQGSGSQT